jgi:hypothetical protein
MISAGAGQLKGRDFAFFCGLYGDASCVARGRASLMARSRDGAIYFFSGRGVIAAQKALLRSEQNLSVELDAALRLQQLSTRTYGDRLPGLYDMILDTAMAALHSVCKYSDALP